MRENKFINYTTLFLISLGVFFKYGWNSFFYFDGGEVPLIIVLPRMVVISVLLVVFNLMVRRIHRKEPSWKKLGAKGAISSFALWGICMGLFLIDIVQRRGWYGTLEHINPMILVELLHLAVVAYLTAYVVHLRRQSRSQKHPDILDD